MKDHHIRTTLKILGIIVLIWGIKLTAPSIRMYYRHIRSGNLIDGFSYSPVIELLSIALTILSVCIILSGYGLLLVKPWSRRFAIGVFGADFLTRLAGAVNGWTWYWRHPEHKQLYEQMMEQVAKEPEKYHTFTVSVIPSYIEGILALCIVIFLMSKPIKEYYKSIKPVKQAAINS